MKTKSSQKNIPKGWQATKLAHVFEFKNGLNKEKKFFGYGTPIINYMDINRGGGLYENNIRGKVDVNQSELTRFNVKRGDVFFTRTSETLNEIGFSAVALDNFKNTVFSGFVLRARPKGELLVPEYSQYCFRAQSARKEIMEKSSYTTRALTSGTLLNHVNMNLPPLSEQHRIVAVLETWDQAIEKLKKKIEIRKQIKKGVMQDLLTGKKRLKGFKNDWGFVELGEVCKRITKRNEVNNQNILTISAQDGLVSQGSYYYKRIAADSLVNYRLLSKGDFAYNKSYSKGYPMGAIKRLNKYKEGIVSSLYIVFSAHAINPDYLEHYFNLGLYNKEIALVAQEGARNHGLLNIGVEDFFSGDLYIPKSRKEQDAIAKILTTADTELEQLTNKLTLLKDQKKYLLNNLINGAIRTPENLRINI